MTAHIVPVEVHNPRTRSEFAECIRQVYGWREDVSQAVDLMLGQMLLRARNELPHGEFTDMVDADLPFTMRSAQRFMSIASNPALAKSDIVSLLPNTVRARYEASRLAPETLQEMADSGRLAEIAKPPQQLAASREAAHVEARKPEDLKLPIIGPTDWAATMKGYRLVSGRSQLEIDERSGLQSGYTGKLEVDVRRDWNESAWDRLNGLGLVMILVPAIDSIRLDKCPCCGAVKR